MTAAMVLAAGLGTRLRPLTDELPKPLVPIGDRPAVAHIIERLARAGVARCALNTHHLPEAFSPELLASLPIPLAIAAEPELLGTAGGVENAKAALGPGDVVVWNGDILIDLDVQALLARHRAMKAGATLAVAPRGVGEGTVGLGADGSVVRLRGEHFGNEVSGGDFVGVSVLGAALRERLPRSGCLVGDVYLPALRRGEALATFEAPTLWDDIGTIAAYLAANQRWLETTGRSSFVGEGAHVGPGVTLDRSIVGEGALVSGEGVLRGVVVLPFARAEAPLESVVVTRSGLVARA